VNDTKRYRISVECDRKFHPKLLLKTKPCPPSISSPHFNPRGNGIVSFHTYTKLLGMDTILRKQTISIFRVPPEDANSKFL